MLAHCAKSWADMLSSPYTKEKFTFIKDLTKLRISSTIALMLQWGEKLDFCRGSITFHASPSIIIMLNPLASALRITHQAASA